MCSEPDIKPLNLYNFIILGSLAFMSQPVGSIASGFLQEAFGSKRCMLVVNIPQLIGWIILYFATNKYFLYFAAVILGISIGCMEAPVLSYVGEITQPSLRGVLSSLSETFVFIGALVECIIGALTDWRSTCGISAIFPVTAFMLISMVICKIIQTYLFVDLGL